MNFIDEEAFSAKNPEIGKTQGGHGKGVKVNWLEGYYMGPPEKKAPNHDISVVTDRDTFAATCGKEDIEVLSKYLAFVVILFSWPARNICLGYEPMVTGVKVNWTWKMFFRNTIEDTLGLLNDPVDRSAGLSLFQATKPNAPILMAYCKSDADPNDPCKFVNSLQPVYDSLHGSLEAVDIKREGRPLPQKRIEIVRMKHFITKPELNASICLGRTITPRESSYSIDKLASPSMRPPVDFDNNGHPVSNGKMSAAELDTYHRSESHSKSHSSSKAKASADGFDADFQSRDIVKKEKRSVSRREESHSKSHSSSKAKASADGFDADFQSRDIVKKEKSSASRREVENEFMDDFYTVDSGYVKPDQHHSGSRSKSNNTSSKTKKEKKHHRRDVEEDFEEDISLVGSGRKIYSSDEDDVHLDVLTNTTKALRMQTPSPKKHTIKELRHISSSGAAKKSRQRSPLFNASDEAERSLSPPVDIVYTEFNGDFYAVGNDNGESAEELLMRATEVATPVDLLLEENTESVDELIDDTHQSTVEKTNDIENYWEVLEEEEDAHE